MNYSSQFGCPNFMFTYSTTTKKLLQCSSEIDYLTVEDCFKKKNWFNISFPLDQLTSVKLLQKEKIKTVDIIVMVTYGEHFIDFHLNSLSKTNLKNFILI